MRQDCRCDSAMIPTMAERRTSRAMTWRARWPNVRAVLLLPLLLGGCVAGSFDPSKPLPPVDVGGFDAEVGHKNLQAIREMLRAQEPHPRDESKMQTPPPPDGEPAAEQPSEPAKQAELRQGNAETPAAASGPPPGSVSKALQTPPQRPSRLDLGIGPVNPYRPHSADRQSSSFSPVPPYTVFTPAGSAYPGSIRCVPDSLGGQRCQTMP